MVFSDVHHKHYWNPVTYHYQFSNINFPPYMFPTYDSVRRIWTLALYHDNGVVVLEGFFPKELVWYAEEKYLSNN